MPTSPTNTSPRRWRSTCAISSPRSSTCGTDRAAPCSPDPNGFAAASDATLRRSRRALLKTARRLLRRASDYLESHAAQFPLYDPQANVLNRCSIDGKLVQTR